MIKFRNCFSQSMWHLYFIAVAAKVLGKERHKFENQTMELKIYRDRLGIIPSGHDTSQPCLKIPADIMIANIDTNIIQYVKDVPEAKKQLENEVMKKLNARIDWNHKKNTELQISCTIKKEDKDARNLVKDWEDAVHQSIQFFITTISIEKRECLKNTWSEVCKEMKKIRKGHQTIAVIEKAGEHTCTIYVVGPGKTVKKVHQQVDHVCGEIEEKLEFLKDTVQVSELEKAVIEKAGVMNNMVKGHPKLKIRMGQEGVIFEGPPKDILDTQKELNSFLKSLQREQINVSKGHLKVLAMLRRQPDNPIDVAMEQCKAVIYTDDQNVTIAGIGHDVNRCQEILSKNIKEAAIDVKEDEVTALREAIWPDFANHLFVRCKGVLHIEFIQKSLVVNVVAYWEDMVGILEDIKMHIKKNAIKEVFLEMGVPYTRMITQWMTKDLERIMADFQSSSIQITGHGEGFQIKGTEDGLQPVKLRITQMKETVVQDIHTVTTPGMPYYFTQIEQGISYIKTREDKYQVIIHYKTSDTAHTMQESHKPTPLVRAPNILEEATHGSGVVIKVIVGDMTSHKVDAIVNAANSELKHHGGLARAIADKGNRK